MGHRLGSADIREADPRGQRWRDLGLGSRPGPPAAVAATHHQGAPGMRLPGRGIRGGIRGGVRGWAQSWLFSRMCLRACSWEVGSALPEAQVVGEPPSLRGRQNGEQGWAGASPGRLLPCSCLPPDLSSKGVSAVVVPRNAGTVAPPMGVPAALSLGACVSQDTALLPSPLPGCHTSLLPAQLSRKTRCPPLSRPCWGPGGGGPAALRPPPPCHLRETSPCPQ